MGIIFEVLEGNCVFFFCFVVDEFEVLNGQKEKKEIE